MQTVNGVIGGLSILRTNLILLLMIFMSTPVSGQVSLIEEITVTAQKREQSIQDVGIAITAFSGEQLDALGVESSIDIINMTPGVQAGGDLTGGRILFMIRGVVQNDFTSSVESPVAVYVDEGYIAATQGQNFASYDLERAEILKGPQGTLFGRNATGGLVHFITRKPTEENEGYLDLTYGSYDQVRVEGAVSGAITDSVSGRLSGMFNRHDGILNNLFPLDNTPLGGSADGEADDIWNDNTWAVRGQLLFDSREDMNFLVSVNASRSEIGVSPYQSGASVPVVDAQGRIIEAVYAGPNETREAISTSTTGFVTTALGVFPVAADGGVDIAAANGGFPVDGDFDGVRPTPGGDLFGHRDPDGSGFDISNDLAIDDRDEIENIAVTGKFTWDINESMTLTSITDYKYMARNIALGVENGPANQAIFLDDADWNQFSQELRLNGNTDNMEWVAGLYYLFIDNNTLSGLSFPSNSTISLSAAGFGLTGTTVGFDGLNDIDLETNSYSAFGQFDLSLNEQWSVIAGLRLVLEEKDYERTIRMYQNLDDTRAETDTLITNTLISDADGNLAAPFSPARTPFSESTSDLLWTGKLQINYRPNDDWLIYAGVNRGVKAGSFNAKIYDFTATLPDSQLVYDKEVLWSFEVGFKSTLLDGRAQLNANYFHYIYNDYQAFVFETSSGIVQNADAEVDGIEIELKTNPFDGLNLSLGAAFIDPKVKDLEVAPNIFRDVRPSFTARMQLAGILSYDFADEILGGQVRIVADANYNSPFYHNIRNFQASKLPSYIVGNARVIWTSPDEQWQTTFFVNNLADERYRSIGFDLSGLCGCNEEFYGKPRWFGGSIRYSF